MNNLEVAYDKIVKEQHPYPFEMGVVIEPMQDSGPLKVFLHYSGDIVYVEHFYFPVYNNGTGASNLPNKGATVLISWLPGKIPCYMGCMNVLSFPVAGEPANTTESLKGDASRLPQENGENKTIGPKQQLLKLDNYGNFAITDSSLSGLISNRDYGGLLLQAMQLVTSTDAEASFSGIWKREDPDSKEVVNVEKLKEFKYAYEVERDVDGNVIESEEEEEPECIGYRTSSNATYFPYSTDSPKSRSYYKRLAESILDDEKFRSIAIAIEDTELLERQKIRPIVYEAKVNDIDSDTKEPRLASGSGDGFYLGDETLDGHPTQFVEDNTVAKRTVIFGEDTRYPKFMSDISKSGSVYVNIQSSLDLFAGNALTQGMFRGLNLKIEYGSERDVTNGIKYKSTGTLTPEEQAKVNSGLTIEEVLEESDPKVIKEDILDPRGTYEVEATGPLSLFTDNVLYLQGTRNVIIESGLGGDYEEEGHVSMEGEAIDMKAHKGFVNDYTGGGEGEEVNGTIIGDADLLVNFNSGENAMYTAVKVTDIKSGEINIEAAG